MLCGGAAIGFTKLLYWVEDQFDRLPVSKLWHPAIGALGLGIIGYFVPRVLGVGYDTISDILNNSLTWKLLLLIAVFKSMALVISLGSGTSGGLLAPMFMASAALGGDFRDRRQPADPGAELAPGAFALVAMGAVFGAAARATFAFIVFAFEITRDYNAVLPLMLVCVIADAIAMRYLPNSIMTEKLARRGLDTHSEYEAVVLKRLRVREIMAQDVVTVAPDETIRSVADRLHSGDPRLMRYHALPIVDREGRLDRPGHARRHPARARRGSGRRHAGDRRRHALAAGGLPGRKRLRRAHQDAAEQRRPLAGRRSRRSAQTGGLPQPRQRHGLLGPHLHEETVREPGWFGGSRGTGQRRNDRTPDAHGPRGGDRTGSPQARSRRVRAGIRAARSRPGHFAG